MNSDLFYVPWRVIRLDSDCFDLDHGKLLAMAALALHALALQLLEHDDRRLRSRDGAFFRPNTC